MSEALSGSEPRPGASFGTSYSQFRCMPATERGKRLGPVTPFRTATRVAPSDTKFKILRNPWRLEQNNSRPQTIPKPKLQAPSLQPYDRHSTKSRAQIPKDLNKMSQNLLTKLTKPYKNKPKPSILNHQPGSNVEPSTLFRIP